MATILDPELDKQMIERLKQLPQVVQDAIESSEIQQHLRELANTNKLHIDQWQKLENEVMLTLLAFEPIENLQKNIQQNVGVTEDLAKTLAENVSKIVFEPIREQLERELEHPEAKAENLSGVESARAEALQKEAPSAPQSDAKIEIAPAAPITPATPQPTVPTPVQPATPPPPQPVGTVSRTPTSEAYRAGEASSARKNVHDDPYRETPN